MKQTDRRKFLKTTTITGVGLGMAGGIFDVYGNSGENTANKVGIIGLDTSHSIAFTKALNTDGEGKFNGYKVVAAYAKGSNDIQSSTSRIPGYTEEIRKYGVEIAGSIESLLTKVDVVLLETNDGRLHLEQALPVLKAGKRMFIDKPMAASLADSIAIFEASKKYNVPVFSSSSLRYISGMDEVKSGKIGRIVGAEVYSPMKFEKTHPDLFWYGIHGVEMLFTAMGVGCKQVVRICGDDADVVVGTWNDNRIGVFRGIRKWKQDYGGTVFGEDAIKVFGKYAGYTPLLVEITNYFKTGIVPVKQKETLEIMAFMEAADVSKAAGGTAVDLGSVMNKGLEKAAKIKI